MSIQSSYSKNIKGNWGKPKLIKLETSLKYTDILKAEYLAESNVMAGQPYKKISEILQSGVLKDKSYKENTID